MDDSLIAPELRRARRGSVDLPVDRPWGRLLVRAGVRLLPGARVEGVHREVARSGGARARIHTPERPRTDAVLLWIHGGGHLIGGAVMDDRFCGETARETGMRVVAAEYRLSPEHPFPAAHDDALAALAAFCPDPSRVVVGGGSAGGGLAAGVVQRLCDEGRAPLGQLLVEPMLDDRTAGRRDLDAVAHPVWDNRRNRAGWAAYLARVAADEPYAVPARRRDLTGLPATWLGVGDADLFLEEDLDYARRLEAAGVEVSTVVVPGAPHGFEGFGAETTLARRFLADARRWLSAVASG